MEELVSVDVEVSRRLEAAREILARLLAVEGPRTPENTLAPYDELWLHLHSAGMRANLDARTHPDPEVRARAAALFGEARALGSEMSLHEGLHDALRSLETSGLDPGQRWLVERTLSEQRRAGVDSDKATRERLQALAEAEDSLVEQFERNLREDTRRVVLAPEQLAGLPEDFLQAHPAGEDGMVSIGTDQTDFGPVLTYAHDASARREIFLAYFNRGWPANAPLLRELLAVRREAARLVGFRDHADRVTHDQMARSGAAVAEFLEQVLRAGEARTQRDYAALLERKRRDEPEAEAVEVWDVSYYTNLVRDEQHAFDAREVRPYLDEPAVRRGLLDVAGRLFGVEFRPAPQAPRWHEDVEVHDVYEQGRAVGRVSLDLYPRPGKFRDGAQFAVVPGAAGRQLPEAALVCNFPRGLMEHRQVVTMFHEFGHLMHYLLSGRQRWVRFAGFESEEDFMEVPSLLFEEWAWDPGTLGLFARHHQTGAPIPADLVRRMRDAAEFGQGVYGQRQAFFALLSLRLHQVDPETTDADALAAELHRRTRPEPVPEEAHLPTSFPHLLHQSAAYYSYLWSLVIAKDLLSEFRKNGLLDPATARRYRETLLEPGSSRPAAELVRDFLGRDFGFEAFRHWMEGEPV